MRRTVAAVALLAVCAGCAEGAPSGGGASASGRPAAAPHVTPGRTGTATAAEPSGSAVSARLRYRFPVRGRASYSQAHHDYPASDIFAACRTPVVAPVRGRVLEVNRRDRYRPGTDRPALRGGRFFSMRGADGVRYYGSHLRSLAAGMKAGRRLRAGQMIGRVGQSGNARGTGCHLHFGISPVCRGRGDWRVRRGAVWPYRFLRAWQRDRDRSPAPAVRRWRRDHGCPA